jgi:3-deoxy-D-manno-octulosonic-acid transferase
MYALYTILFILGGIGLLPYLLWRCLCGAAYHHDLRERFGRSAAAHLSSQALTGCLWFHAASVGEVQGLRPILAALHARFPQRPVVFSTFTPTGKLMARRVAPEAAAVFLLPLDLPWLMRRVVRRLRPWALIIEETELWPQLFRAAAQQQVPVVVVNGRLSPRAFARYMRIRPLIRRTLAHVTLLLAQSAASAERFQHLGMAAPRVRVVGHTNIDRALLAAQQPAPVHPFLPLVQGQRLLVGGSTHEGEETALLSVYRRLQRQYSDLLLVLAPRHLERVDAVVRHVQAFQCQALRRSQCAEAVPEKLAAPTVVILDTFGELLTLYRLCTVAFVGGSLVPIGGHNILEPAVFAKPLFFGPYMQHFPELAAMLCAAGGAIQVRNTAELFTHIGRILAHPDEGQAMGQRALQALLANQGALERTTQAVSEFLQRCEAFPGGL